MRKLLTHHDGYGLNESIRIIADDRDQSGASHHYVLTIGGASEFDTDSRLVGEIQFQQGPRNVAGSIPGVTEAAILAVLIDRLEGFQAGPYACWENAEQLSLLRQALAMTRARADARAARGVLGKNEK